MRASRRVVEDGFRLGQWIGVQRRTGRKTTHSSPSPPNDTPETERWLFDVDGCSGLERPWLRAAKPYPDVAGSGDKQASAKLCCVEIDEVAVAFGPPT
jgi:hypothetical protein